RRTRRDAAGLQAMKATPHHVGGIQASRLFGILHLVERDQRVGLGRQGRGVREPHVRLQLGVFALAVVPLFAGHLAGPATDAVGNVDQRRADGNGLRSGRGARRRHDRLSFFAAGALALALATLTRQAFVSCVPAPGSEASIVRWLTLGPVERPWKPQLYGIQTTVTSWPPMFSAFIRGVTRALTSSSPRADDTRTQSPDSISSFWARATGSSTIGSGTSSLSQGIFRVVEP